MSKPEVAEPLAGVKVGDVLVCERSKAHADSTEDLRDLCRVQHRTPKFISARGNTFKLSGSLNGRYRRGPTLRLPMPGEIEEIEARDAERRRRKQDAAEKRKAKESTPEWQAAHGLVSNIGCTDADGLLAEYGPTRIIAAYRALKE